MAYTQELTSSTGVKYMQNDDGGYTLPSGKVVSADSMQQAGQKVSELGQPNTSTKASDISTPKLEQASGYKDTQVGIPGVNLYEPKKIETPKVETPNLGVDTTTTPVSPSTSTTTTDPFAEQHNNYAQEQQKEQANQSQFADTFEQQRQDNLDALKKQTEQIKTEGEKAVEETKKQYLLGQQKFNQNKDYIENFDEVNNLYTSVVNDLVKSMGDSGVINENTYQQIANTYNLTLDEVKNAEKILDRAKYTEEGKKKTGQTEGEQSIADMEIARDRKIKDMQTSLDRTLQNYNWQIEDIEKQVTRNLAFMEASGAWSGAGRSSGFIAGMQNVKKDGETMINRLKTLAQQASEATGEEIARLQEDFKKAHTKAKEDLTEQLKQFTTNTMLALTEAQATYGMGSTKLQDLLKDIGVNLENQYYEQIERYYRIEDSINKKQLENLTYLQQIADQETAKIDTNYNNYLSNNGAILQNTSLTTVAQDLREGKINPQRANDLKQIMLSSIQSTLGAIAPVTTQDLKTIETLLMQGYTPAEIVAEMQSLEKFTPKTSVKDRFMNVPGNLYDMVNETWVNPTDTTSTSTSTGYTGYTGGFQDLTNVLQRPTGSTNVGQDTNNPGNIMAETPQGKEYAKSLGAIGFYTSPNGRTYAVFPDMETGLQATRQDIASKLNGGSSWVTQNTTLGELAHGWTSGPNDPNINENAIKNFERLTGFNRNTPISQIDQNTLIDAIVKNEGVNINKGADLSYLSQPTQGEDSTTYKTDAIPQFESYLKTGKIGTNQEEMKAIKEEFGSVENFRKQAEAYNNDGPRQKELEKIEKLKNQVQAFISPTKKGALDNSIGAWQWTGNAKLPFSTRLEKESYLADIQNFLEGKTLQQLIDAKADGATFGALSNEELRMLQNSSSKLNQLALRKDKNDPNKITGFSGTKENFEKVVKETVAEYMQIIEKKQKQMGKTGQLDTTGTSTQVKSSSGNVYIIKPKK